ncbi:oligosaccharide flippase family protein [Turicibacter sanguinis]|uniref:lipopolysaccharide biosynthesis protein n=1 Tax=Turicibacter sanguinis TaxID=154288 RepID=UPI00325C0260
MKIGKELVKNTAIISVGKICTQLVSFLLLPLYTKILTPEEYGIVDLVIVYGQLLLPVATLQLEQAMFRFLIEKRNSKEGQEKVISNIVLLTFFATLVTIIILFILFKFLENKYGNYIIVILCVNIIFAMLLQISRGLGENKIYAVGSFLVAAFQVTLNVLFVGVFKFGAEGMLISMILSYSMASVFLIIVLRKNLFIKFTFPKLDDVKLYLRYSFPLVPNAISWWILSASDRTIIMKFLGVSYNGIYSTASKFPGVYTTLFNIFNLSWTESVSLHLNKKDSNEEFSIIQTKILSICITAALGLIAIMPFVFNILVDKKYGNSYYQIPFLTIGVFFSSMVGLISAYYIADKNTTIIAKSSMYCAIINVLLNLLLVKFIGLYASSISTIIAYSSLFVIRYFDIKKKYGVNLEKKLILISLLMLIVLLSTYFLKNIILSIISLLLYTLFSFYINRLLLKDVFNLIKKLI